VRRFRGGLVFKAHRRLYHSTLDSREREALTLVRRPMARNSENCAASCCSGSEAGSYLRLIEVCITPRTAPRVAGEGERERGAGRGVKACRPEIAGQHLSSSEIRPGMKV